MSTAKRKYKLSDFFIGFFENFGKMFIVNLLFDIPLIILVGAIMLISYFTGNFNIFVCFLLIPLLSPFFAGMMNVCRKLTTGESFKPIKDFVKGIKDNLCYFLINGGIIYIISIGAWTTFSFYRNNTENPIVILALISSSIVLIYFLFMEFLIPVMFVSVKIKLSDVIKNSVFLAVIGFFNNLKTLISFLFIFCILFIVCQYTANFLINTIIISFLVLTFLPVLCTYILTFNSYQTVEKYVIKPYEKENKEQKEMSKGNNNIPEIDIEELMELSNGDPDEFVFINGRMLKRSSIKKLLEKQKDKI